MLAVGRVGASGEANIITNISIKVNKKIYMHKFNAADITRTRCGMKFSVREIAHSKQYVVVAVHFCSAAR